MGTSTADDVSFQINGLDDLKAFQYAAARCGFAIHEEIAKPTTCANSSFIIPAKRLGEFIKCTTKNSDPNWNWIPPIHQEWMGKAHKILESAKKQRALHVRICLGRNQKPPPVKGKAQLRALMDRFGLQKRHGDIGAYFNGTVVDSHDEPQSRVLAIITMDVHLKEVQKDEATAWDHLYRDGVRILAPEMLVAGKGMNNCRETRAGVKRGEIIFMPARYLFACTHKGVQPIGLEEGDLLERAMKLTEALPDYDRVMTERSITAVRHFDQAMGAALRKADRKRSKNHNLAGILVFGIVHIALIKELLLSRKYSYIVVLPGSIACEEIPRYCKAIPS